MSFSRGSEAAVLEVDPATLEAAAAQAAETERAEIAAMAEAAQQEATGRGLRDRYHVATGQVSTGLLGGLEKYNRWHNNNMTTRKAEFAEDRSGRNRALLVGAYGLAAIGSVVGLALVIKAGGGPAQVQELGDVQLAGGTEGFDGDGLATLGNAEAVAATPFDPTQPYELDLPPWDERTGDGSPWNEVEKIADYLGYDNLTEEQQAFVKNEWLDHLNMSEDDATRLESITVPSHVQMDQWLRESGASFSAADADPSAFTAPAPVVPPVIGGGTGETPIPGSTPTATPETTTPPVVAPTDGAQTPGGETTAGDTGDNKTTWWLGGGFLAAAATAIGLAAWADRRKDRNSQPAAAEPEVIGGEPVVEGPDGATPAEAAEEHPDRDGVDPATAVVVGAGAALTAEELARRNAQDPHEADITFESEADAVRARQDLNGLATVEGADLGGTEDGSGVEPRDPAVDAAEAQEHLDRLDHEYGGPATTPEGELVSAGSDREIGHLTDDGRQEGPGAGQAPENEPRPADDDPTPAMGIATVVPPAVVAGAVAHEATQDRDDRSGAEEAPGDEPDAGAQPDNSGDDGHQDDHPAGPVETEPVPVIEGEHQPAAQPTTEAHDADEEPVAEPETGEQPAPDVVPDEEVATPPAGGNDENHDQPAADDEPEAGTVVQGPAATEAADPEALPGAVEAPAQTADPFADMRERLERYRARRPVQTAAAADDSTGPALVNPLRTDDDQNA